MAAGKSGGTMVRPRPLQSTSRLLVSHLQEKGQAERVSTAYRAIQQVIPGGVGVRGWADRRKENGRQRLLPPASIPSSLVHIIMASWLYLL